MYTGNKKHKSDVFVKIYYSASSTSASHCQRIAEKCLLGEKTKLLSFSVKCDKLLKSRPMR